jgi:hypothetical protein
MGEERKVYGVLVGRPEGKRPLRSVSMLRFSDFLRFVSWEQCIHAYVSLISEANSSAEMYYT